MRRFVFFLAALLAPLPASSAILWSGGEDSSIVVVGTATPSTTPPASFDSAFARGTMFVGNGATGSDPPTNYFKTPAFASTAIIWVHANTYLGSANTNTVNNQSMFAFSPDGVGRVYLRHTGTSGQVKLSTATAARTFSDKQTATGTFSAAAIQTIDWLIDYSCSAGSVTQLYINGVKVIDYTGSLCTDAATSLNQVGFGGLTNISGAGSCSSATSSSCWSEMIVASEDTRSFRLATLAPQASGNTQGWTPNTLANINKFAINDSTFVSDGTGNVLSQWTAPTTAPAGLWIVKSVAIEARILKSASGPSRYDGSWRISGTDYLSGISGVLSTSFANYRIQQDNSPATSTAWSLSEIYNSGASQLNFGLKSLP